MPFYADSPFDPEPLPGEWADWDIPGHSCAIPETPACPRFDWQAAARDFAAIVILSARFAALSFVIVLGVPLFAFFVVAGWDLSLLFAWVGDLADHYRSAEPLRRLAFGEDTLALFLVTVGLVSLVRMPRFAREVSDLFKRSAKA